MRILVITGSTRASSTNTAALLTAQAFPPPGVAVDFYGGLGALPHFNPDNDVDPLPPPVAALRAAIGSADALLFCTPEYAGTLPGSFKNLLDWTVGGMEMNAKPVAWLNVAAPTRGEGAIATLRVVLGYVTATILDDCCIRIAVAREMVGLDGLVADTDARARITALVASIAERVSE
ncbi:MAG TPA: NADPH-dependent FMN reductase [Kofleriaceae bacterium]